MVDHPHAEALRSLGNRAADAAEADDAERRVVHVLAEVLR